VDEYHEHTSDELVDTFVTGMASREQPLLLVITTAGVDTASPCYAMRQDMEGVVSGVFTDETAFALIYTLDPEDDWTTEDSLRKANPNWGISKLPEIVLAEQQAAVRDARKQTVFRTKHLNVWCGARSPYFNVEAWRAAADPSLRPEGFAGDPCFAGMDLAAKRDLASVLLLFRRDVNGCTHYYVFGKHYLPEDEADDPTRQHYRSWAIQGYLTLTDGNVIDHERIRDDLVADHTRYQLRGLGYDPYGATMLVTQLLAESVPAVEVRMTTPNLSEPMKWLEAMIVAGRVHHNGDPVLAWMLNNVTAKVDANDNVFPRKDRDENKIDGAVALILAMGRALADSADDGRSVYETRGLVVI
jgi:phage terminase large subunit-like protein